MSIQNDVSEAEWQVRVELAACFRLLDIYGMSDHTSSHAAVRVPGEPEYFLVNPFGWLFDEITASSLVKVDLDGRIQDGGKINGSGYTVHGAVLAARDDVNCSIHTHTRANVAVASMADGLLPLSQHSLQFFERTSYHDYDRHTDEMKRLQQDLGQNWAMMLRNHGVLVAGRTVSEAFQFTQRLEIAEIRRRHDQLSQRECEVLGQMMDGQLNKQIAHTLGISQRTVEVHRANVMDKMQAPSLADLVKQVMRLRDPG